MNINAEHIYLSRSGWHFSPKPNRHHHAVYLSAKKHNACLQKALLVMKYARFGRQCDNHYIVCLVVVDTHFHYSSTLLFRYFVFFLFAAFVQFVRLSRLNESV